MGRIARRVLLAMAVVVAALLALLWTSGRGWFGEPVTAGVPRGAALPFEVVERRGARQAGAFAAPKQILFGDLHVHSTFSLDAFQMSLPMSGGEGAHPVSDACDFARYCSGLDFWSINDHATALTPRRWRETVEAVRQCDGIAEGAGGEPDLVSLLGWEWTQMGSRPENHWGHKNVILRGLADDEIPTRPIAAAPPDGVPSAFNSSRGGAIALGAAALLVERGHDLAAFLAELAAVPECPAGVPVRDLPEDCSEQVKTPGELFAKLDDWGVPSLVIPHGTTWGMYTPPGSDWRKQLSSDQHDPDRQTLIEVYSGHGSSEEYRSWKAVEAGPEGRRCPEPTAEYLPSCWRAGEIIAERCREAGIDEAECLRRAARARKNFVDADRNGGPWTVPGVQASEWLDAGQCRDCFQPAFNHRPQASVQAMLALSNDEVGEPESFRFGFVASSDVHSSRPGTGYKEFARRWMTDARMGEVGRSSLVAAYARDPRPESERFDAAGEPPSVAFFETERNGSFFFTGGLAAVHAEGRSRDAVWEALERRETYGTSGPRILLWFDLVNAVGGALPMGSAVVMSEVPEFRVRAAGSFEPKPGCPEHASKALASSEIARLCRGECYFPSDFRRPIQRIEVVRIRRSAGLGDGPERLIEDPWRVFECDSSREGCEVRFSDPEYATSDREALYYVRAIENASPTIGADPLGCSRDTAGRCIELDPCFDRPNDDDCLSPSEHRAWSSPIYVRPMS